MSINDGLEGKDEEDELDMQKATPTENDFLQSKASTVYMEMEEKSVAPTNRFDGGSILETESNAEPKVQEESKES